MAVAGSAGVPELLLAVAAGGLAGAPILVAVGAPNRRPTPAAVRAGCWGAGSTCVSLDVERAVGGRAQLYRVATPDGPLFLKVYGQDSRDADLLYRSLPHRRAPRSRRRPSSSLASDVEHEALLLLLAERGGVACPPLRAVVALPDGSMVLAMEDVGGRGSTSWRPTTSTTRLLDDVWRQVERAAPLRSGHGALRAANVLVTTAGQVG